MKYITLCLLCVCIYAQASVEKKNIHVLFDTDQYTLKPEAIATLDQILASYSNQNAYIEFYISGHTDSDGSNAYNDNLSQQRADAVIAYLTSHGLPAQWIEKNTFGEKKPLLANNNEENKSQNRRVEIVIQKYKFESADEIISYIAEPVKAEYIADNTHPIEIKAEQGIALTFPPHCFESEDGQAFDEKNIKIELIAATTPTDMIFNNLVCTSDEGLLESGGMYKITARSGDVELKLKDDTTYRATLQNKNPKQNMAVYTGITNSNGTTSWLNTKNTFSVESTFQGELPYITLDKGIIDTWKFRSKLQDEYVALDTKIPALPSYIKGMRKPKPPIAPSIYAKKYQLKGIQKLILSKKMEEKKLQDNFSKDNALYLARWEKYEAKLDKYETYLTQRKDIENKNSDSYKAFKKEVEDLYMDLYLAGMQITQGYAQKYFPVVKYNLMKSSTRKNLRSTDLIAHCNLIFKNYISKNPSYKNDILYVQNYLQRIDKFANSVGLTLQLKHDSVQVYQMSNLKRKRNFVNEYFNTYMDYRAVKPYFNQLTMNYVDDKVKTGMMDPNNYDQYYATELAEMNWVNCDRFKQTDFQYVLLSDTTHYKADKFISYMPKINSCINLYKNGNKLNMPKEDAVVIRIVVNNENKPMMGTTRVSQNNMDEVTITCEEVRLVDIKNAIASL